MARLSPVICICALFILKIQKADAWTLGAITHCGRFGSSTLLARSFLCSADDEEGSTGGLLSLDDLEEKARQVSVKALEDVFELNISAEKALQRTLRSLSSSSSSSSSSAEQTQDAMIIQRRWFRSRIKELVLGTSIYRLRHEYVLNQTFSTNQTSSTERRIRDMVDLHADFLPTNDANADNGISIAWPSDPAERISVQQSIPKFLVELWTDQYGVEETESLCRVSNHPGPVTLRRNKIRCTTDDRLIRKLKREEEVTAKQLRTVFLSHEKKTWKPPDGCLRVVSLPLNKSIWSLSSWKEGWFEVQDVGSQLIVKSVEAKPGDHIIDFCAGNGGKTLALASELHSTTNVSTTSATLLVAHDIMPDRLAQLRGSLDRAGLLQETSNVRVSTTSDVDDDIPDGLADAVLVDAPCSSCGVLRRRPSQRWMLTMHDMCDVFPRLQLSILKRAARLVKPGGRLVYATCSVSEFENQNVLEEWEASTDYFFLNYRPWTFNDAEDWPPQYGMPAHCRQLLPHIHDSDGFFFARWRRAPIDMSN